MDMLQQLASEPDAAALLFDIDGALAPIVPRPEDARVPPETRSELRRLNAKYGLVACVTGRDRDDARAIVGVDELVYVGNHGLEFGADADAWAERMQAFLGTVTWQRTENKHFSAALHYRDVEDQRAARAQLDHIAERAHANGFRTRFGRKVLEILPPLDTNK